MGGVEGETIAVDVASADGADESSSVTAVRTKGTDAEGDEDGVGVMSCTTRCKWDWMGIEQRLGTVVWED